MRRIVVPAVMLVVVGLMFWAGVHNLRARRAMVQQRQQQAAMSVTKDGDASSGGASATADTPAAAEHLRGHAAPGFTLVSTEGKKVSLADYKGKPVVVNFWATWCGPCKLEMPWFEEFSHKYAGQGLVVLGIAEDEGAPKEDVIKAAQKVGATYPILLTDGKVSPAYGGVDYLPETFYVDKNGTVVEETAGAPSKDEMEANIKKVIGS